jgi:hypothetical protein
MAKTTYYSNLLLGAKRGVALSYPATDYVGMMVAGKGARSAFNSQAVALNDIICLTPNGASRLSLYKVTTAGTLAAAQSTLYPGAANEAITDGTAVLTEQSTALLAMTGASMVIAAEPTVGTNGYARMAMASNTTNWAAASAGQIQNASTAWTFPQATPAGWTTGSAVVWGLVVADQAAQGGGNIWEWWGLPSPIQVSALATVSFAAGQITVTEG